MTESPGWGAATVANDSAGTRRHWLAYGVALMGVFMTLLDATIVNVAVVPIQRDLHTGYDAVEWVLTGYALAFALTVIPGGRLGDRFGHKRIFLFGLAGFTIASVLCSVSTSAGELIAWRVVEGAMAGFINPAILGLAEKMFPPAQRGQAYATYGATAGLASALGPLLGGLLIAWNLNGWDWRPVFAINVPLGIICFIGVALLAPEARGRGGSLDEIGILLVSGASLLLTYPLVEGQQHGWPKWSFVMLGLSLPAFVIFALWEARRLRRGAVPLVDIRLFRNRAFAAGVSLSMFFFAGFVGFLFVMSVHLQIGLGHSALYTGLALLPYAGGAFFGAASSDPLTRKLGRSILFIGTVLVMAGLISVIVTLHVVGDSGVSSVQLLPSMLAAGIGTGFIIAPCTGFVLATVPWQDTGSAGGVLNAALRYGQALGVAIVGVVLFGGIGGQAAASSGSLRADYTHSAETTVLYPLGAIVITFLLVFFMPKRTPDASEWASEGNSNWGTDNGQWSAGGADGNKDWSGDAKDASGAGADWSGGAKKAGAKKAKDQSATS